MSYVAMLALLNDRMGGIGTSSGGNGLFFYTHVLAYRAEFGVGFEKFAIKVFDKWLPDYGFVAVLDEGTLNDAVDTLNERGPFLLGANIDAIWADVDM